MAARFEIRTTDSGVHVGGVGANGEDVFTTEVYGDRRTAREAIEFMGHMFGANEATFGPTWATFSLKVDEEMETGISVPIRYVDQRTQR